MKTIKTKVYQFNELSDEAKEKAIERFADINVDHDWWECTYEDAATVNLKLTEFDIDRSSYCKGQFIENAEDTANAIVKHHGESCETHKTAINYLDEIDQLWVKWPEKLDDEDYDENEAERENQQQMLADEFLKDILEDYRIMLQKEYEYLTSEEAIVETITINEYDFTEDGKLF